MAAVLGGGGVGLEGEGRWSFVYFPLFPPFGKGERRLPATGVGVWGGYRAMKGVRGNFFYFPFSPFF